MVMVMYPAFIICSGHLMCCILMSHAFVFNALSSRSTHDASSSLLVSSANNLSMLVVCNRKTWFRLVTLSNAKRNHPISYSMSHVAKNPFVITTQLTIFLT